MQDVSVTQSAIAVYFAVAAIGVLVVLSIAFAIYGARLPKGPPANRPAASPRVQPAVANEPADPTD